MDDIPIEHFLKKVCAECGGWCCKGAFISEGESDALQRAGYKDFLRPSSHSSERFLKTQKNLDCVFLSKDGCSLPQELKPLDCKFFPLFPVEKEGEIAWRFHSKGFCPFVSHFQNPEWLKKMSVIGEQKLNEWSALDSKKFLELYSDPFGRWIHGLKCLWIRRLGLEPVFGWYRWILTSIFGRVKK